MQEQTEAEDKLAKRVALRLRGLDPKHIGIVKLCCGDVGSVTLILDIMEEFNHGEGDMVLLPNGTMGVVTARTDRYFHIKSTSGHSDLRLSQGDYVLFYTSINHETNR